MHHQAILAAEYTLRAHTPTDLLQGEALILSIELRNNGLAPWLTSGPYPVRLGYRWHSSEGLAVADGGRLELPGPVPPGMGLTRELRIEAPAGPGNYRLEVELLEEGRAWFSQLGVAPLRLSVNYAPVDRPRVAILNGNVVANDAVGSHIVSQLNSLRAGGYYALVLTGYVDERLPAEVRRSLHMLAPAIIADPQANHPAAVHFRKADLVIVNYSSYYDHVELIRQVRRGVVLFDYHGVTPPELWGPAWPGYDDLVRGRDNLALVAYADYAVAHSRFTCDELVATGKIAPGRVGLMPYAVVDTSGYAGAPDPEMVARLALAGHHVLLYVGRIARNKRVHDLVAALPAILARQPNTLLLLVGDIQAPAYRAYADEIVTQASRLGVAHAVRLTGQVDDATLENLYRACAIFLTASEHEGFCMPVVEAMARGRPVVAADATGTPHTLGEAGLLFPVGDSAALAEQVLRLLAELPAPGDHNDPLAIHHIAEATEEDLAALGRRKIAIVTPRYGSQILGGAESGLRSWAEQLAARGYTVEALSTGTVDMADWRDHLAPGVEHLNGVTVRRFSAARVQVASFHNLLQRLNRGEQPRYDEELSFISNSLRSNDLERYVAEHAEEYACLIYAPYLFGTTYFPALAVPDKAIVVPCLHDEPSARLGIFRELLERVAGLAYNAAPEGDLAATAMHVANPYHCVLGFGFADDYAVGDAAAFRARTGLEGPVLLYTGRLEHAKNVPLLVEYFIRYKEDRPGPLSLALSGNGDVPLPERPDVVRLGMIERDELADAYAAALALCQLSQNESFSIVIMEAWLQGRPVIVHRDCAVTSDHVTRAEGGYAVADYAAFRAAVDELLEDPERGEALGARGRAYVRTTYAWSSLLPRIEAALARFSRARPLYARLAQRGVARALAFTRQRFADEQLHLAEQMLGAASSSLPGPDETLLAQAALIARSDYQVQSRLPVVGGLVAWVRRQITAHLKEPYLDPVIADQQHFNQHLVSSLLPALETSRREQRRLRAELDLLRSELEHLRESKSL